MKIVITSHARLMMGRRQIGEEDVLYVAASPQQVVSLQGARMVYQSRLHDSIEGKEMLYRIILEQREEEVIIITAYKTSRIDKYWLGEKEP